MKRITQESAFILHHYDWSESSLILDVFTRQLGRMTMVAKGAKKISSNFRPVLLPLQELALGFTLSPESEIATLKSAEWMGRHTLPKGEGLLAAYYCNELLMQLLPREDAHPALFDVYRMAVALLARAHTEQKLEISNILRAFEILSLRQLGFLPALDRTIGGESLQSEQHYQFVPERGLRVTQQGDDAGIPAEQWYGLHQAMQAEFALTELLRVLHSWSLADMQCLRRALRRTLTLHLPRALRTRELMQDFALLNN